MNLQKLASAIASVLISSMLFAAELFVSPTGAGDKSGSNWANALEGFSALTSVVKSGDIVNFSVGDYQVNSQLAASTFTSLQLHGGFTGTDDATPYAKDSSGAVTRLQVKSGIYSRHLSAKNTAITITGITFANGTLNAKGSQGMSIYLDNCQAAVTNCVFDSNAATNTLNGYTYSGGAIYAVNGTLDISDSLFTNNFLRSWHDKCYTYGGAIHTSKVKVSLTKNTFIGNRAEVKYWEMHGGALYFNGGSAEINNCTFLTNSVSGSDGYGNGQQYGAAIKAGNLTSLRIKDSYFAGNYSFGLGNPGSLIYLNSSDGSMETAIEHCIFKDNGVNAAIDSHGASIGLIGGNLTMKNCLIAGTRPSHKNAQKRAIDIRKGKFTMEYCTIADCNGNSVYCDLTAGKVTIRNTIFSNNAADDISNIASEGSNYDIAFSCLPKEYDYGWKNCVIGDPLLSTDGYYHPLSSAGYLSDGYFTGSKWIQADVDSPTIDAGNPKNDWFEEPQPNNLRVNIGYDANTQAASLSKNGDYANIDSLTIVPLPATNTTSSTTTLRAIIAGISTETQASISLVYDSQDKGTASAADWANKVELGTFEKWDFVSFKIQNLLQGHEYHYRFIAANADGTSWSIPQSVKIPVPPTLELGNVTHLLRNSASLTATLVDDGDIDCETTVQYWKESAPSTVYTVDANLVESSEPTRIPITGLTTGTRYIYVITVTNPSGQISLTNDFTTVDANTPIIRYVSPTGAGIQDGTSWENAYNGLPKILTECVVAGDTIYMKQGTYEHFTLNQTGECTEFIILNAKGLSIYGGYEGLGAPGERTPGTTIIKRNNDVKWRLFRINNSTVLFDGITFLNGNYYLTTSGGGAILSENKSNITIKNCKFEKNNAAISNKAGTNYGGAIYASGGSLTISESDFIGNTCESYGDPTFTYGGAIAALGNCNVSITKSRFIKNRVGNAATHCIGGAIYSLDSPTYISDSLFLTNSSIQTATHRDTAMGGALGIRNSPLFRMDNCHFTANYVRNNRGRGGVMMLDTTITTYVPTSVITRCIFDWNGTNENVKVEATGSGAIHLDSGRLFMTNCLISRSGCDNGIKMEVYNPFKDKTTPTGAIREAEFVNVTVADCVGYGINNLPATSTSYPYRLKNAIVWGNTTGGASTNALTATYSCLQNEVEGIGNISQDPQLLNGYYHLSSRSRAIEDGWFGGDMTKRRRPTNSPCIDRGDPTFDASQEPHPNGKRINMGVYGGTPWATPTWYNPGTMLKIQ